jgi:hypothetical protein
MSFLNFGGATLPNDVESVLKNASGFVAISKPVAESSAAVLAQKLFPNLTSGQFVAMVKAFQESTCAAYALNGYTYEEKVAAAQTAAIAAISADGENGPLFLTPAAKPLLCMLTHMGFGEAEAGISTTVPTTVEASVVSAIQAPAKS